MGRNLCIQYSASSNNLEARTTWMGRIQYSVSSINLDGTQPLLIQTVNEGCDPFCHHTFKGTDLWLKPTSGDLQIHAAPHLQLVNFLTLCIPYHTPPTLSSPHRIFSPCLLFKLPSSFLPSSCTSSSVNPLQAQILSTPNSNGPSTLSISPMPTVLTFCLWKY
jgi:hypothetical protein